MKLFRYKNFIKESKEDGKLIILQRLEQVFYDMGLEVPEIENIEGYNIQY